MASLVDQMRENRLRFEIARACFKELRHWNSMIIKENVCRMKKREKISKNRWLNVIMNVYRD